MKNIFHVVIHYHGDTKDEHYVIAQNDIKARELAIKADKKSSDDEMRVKFCEIEFVCAAI